MKDKKQRHEPTIEVLLEYANSIIATLREPFLVLDKNLRVISSNQAFYTTFKVKEKDTIGQLLPDLGNRQWNIPGLLLLLKEVLSEKKVVKDYEVEHKFEQIGERAILLNARQLHVPKQVAAIIAAGIEEEKLILLAIEDITERKLLQKTLKESEERYRRAFETSRDGLLLVHKTEADILNSNESARELLGYSHEELLKKKLWEIGAVKSNKDFRETVSRLERDGVIHYDETPVKTKKGLSINTEIILVNKAKVIQCNIRDITERKRIENELAQAREYQYRTLIENLPQKVFLKDRNSVYISCNENYARDLKIKPEEIVGKTDYDFFPTHLAEKYRADDKKVMESGKTENIEEEYAAIGDYLGGSKRLFVNTVKVPVLDKTGNVTGLFGLFWDITERKRAEDEVKSLKRQMEFILGSAKTGLDIIDSDFNIVYIDPEWAKVYGDYKGRKCYEYFMDKSEVCPNCGITKALESKKITVSEETLVKEGNRPIQVTTIPFQNEKGEWLVAEVNVDITERKRAEIELEKYRNHLEELVKEKTEAIRETEARFKTVFTDTRDGILLADTETRKFSMCNKMICNMLGYTEEEIKCLSVDSIHPEKDLPLVMDIFSKQVRGEIKLGENMPVKRKDGSVFYADINTSWIKLSGKNYLMCSFRDITERKQAEDALRKAYAQLRETQLQLVQAAKMVAVGQLAGGVAHEINNPLTGVLNNIQLIKLMIQEKKYFSREDLGKLLDAVENAAMKCAKTTRSLLDFSHASAGKLQPLSLNDELEKSVVLIESEWKLENILVWRDTETNLPRVFGDPQLLQQVMFELLCNAKWAIQKRYGKEGGSIRIRMFYVPAENMVCFSISDMGIGIPQKIISRIFEPFFTTKSVGEGTGLGLPMAFRIVKEHKGRLEATSDVDKGTTFTMSLPALIEKQR
ncbi:MAG: PAS domain S-box protein [Candidatus Omnitrophica bacterium]|nr:PAS domain S-box protein [Candidatus Omnitrophota bacterium]